MLEDRKWRDFFKPHPNLSPEINDAIVKSEIEGGVYLEDLKEGDHLKIKTQNRWYDIIIVSKNGDIKIKGHPKICPNWTDVKMHGSSWGGAMLKAGFIGRGLHLEFKHPNYTRPVVTSEIQEIEQIKDSSAPLDINAPPN